MNNKFFIAITLLLVLVSCHAINRLEMLHQQTRLQNQAETETKTEEEDAAFIKETCLKFIDEIKAKADFDKTNYCKTTYVPNYPVVPEDEEAPADFDQKTTEARKVERKLDLCNHVVDYVDGTTVAEACDNIDIPHDQDDSKLKKLAGAVSRFGVEDELVEFSIRALKLPTSGKKITTKELGYLVYADKVAISSGTALDIPLISLTVDGVGCSSDSQREAIKANFPGKVCKKDVTGASGIAEVVTGPFNKEEFKAGMTKAKELLIHIGKAASTCANSYTYSNLNLKVLPLAPIIEDFTNKLKDTEKASYSMLPQQPKVGGDYQFFVLCKPNIGSSHNVQLNYALNLAMYDYTAFFSDVMYDPFARDMMNKASRFGQTLGNSVLNNDNTVRGLFTAMFFSSAIKAYQDVYETKQELKAAAWKNVYDQMIKFNFPDIPRFMTSAQQLALKTWIDTRPTGANSVKDFIPKGYFTSALDLYKSVSNTEKTPRTERQIGVAKGILTTLSVWESNAAKAALKKITKSPKPKLDALDPSVYPVYNMFMDKMKTNFQTLIDKTFKVSYTAKACQERYKDASPTFPFGKKVNDPNYPNDPINIADECDSYDRWVPVASNDDKQQVFVVNEARWHTVSVQDFAIKDKSIFDGDESAWPPGVRKLVTKICGGTSSPSC